MTEGTIRLPKWAWAIIGFVAVFLFTSLVSLLVYTRNRDVAVLEANTEAIQKLDKSLVVFSGSVDNLRLDVYGTINRLQDKADAQQKTIEDHEERIRKQEGRR